MQNLLNGNAYPGIVNNDTQVFASARIKRFNVLTFDVVLPDPAFQDFEKKLNAERKQSQYSYGFPDGAGDCNCASKKWKRIPTLEDQLPDEWMPEQFFRFWYLQPPARRAGRMG